MANRRNVNIIPFFLFLFLYNLVFFQSQNSHSYFHLSIPPHSLPPSTCKTALRSTPTVPFLKPPNPPPPHESRNNPTLIPSPQPPGSLRNPKATLGNRNTKTGEKPSSHYPFNYDNIIEMANTSLSPSSSVKVNVTV